ncbi:MAG: amino acid permease [Acetobacteraceae bacterium]|nr:amino acid permease [Acetobacteraceae bacterium]
MPAGGGGCLRWLRASLQRWNGVLRWPARPLVPPRAQEQPAGARRREGGLASDLFRTKPLSEILAESQAGGRRLRRTLTSLDLTVLGVGAIIGTGIFVLTGVAAARFAGPAVVLSFVISGIASALTALVYAELASMVPVAGSAYTYSYAALGELAAWVIGWDLVLEYTVAAGAVSIGWSSYAVDLLASLGVRLPLWATASPPKGGLVNLPAVAVVAAVTALLVVGTRESTTFNRVVVGLKVAVILFFLGVGAFYVRPVNWRPFAPYGFAGIMRGAAIIFFAYIGFDAVSTAAEEVRQPRRDLPIGIIASLVVSTLLYLGVSLVLTGILPYPRLDTASPIARALLSVGVRSASAVVSAGALAGLTSVMLVNIFGQSRVFFAMARDGLLPGSLAFIHPRFRTPVRVTSLTGAAVALIGALLPIETVAELANIGTLAAFVLVSVGVVVLRKRRPDLPRSFRTPLVPYLPALAALFSMWLILSLPWLTWVRFAAWLFLGLGIYFFYGRRRSRLAAALPEAGQGGGAESQGGRGEGPIPANGEPRAAS